jgi:DNA-binding transcriptional LysR family regulator
MRLNLSLRQLEAIVEIAEAGSFRAAARKLDISQPALSRTLRLAEEALGARLFDRDTRRVTITPAGQELLRIARRVLADFDSSLSELGNYMTGHRGQVSVAALPSVNVALLPAAIAKFRQQHPNVEFKLQEWTAELLLAAVEEGRADFGLCAKPAPDQRLRYEALLDDPMMLVCRADDAIAHSSNAPWSLLAEKAYVGIQPGSSIRQIIDSVLLRRKLAVRATLEAPSVAACCALVREGLGIAALPRLALGLADMQNLTAVPLVQPAISRSVGIVTRIGRTLSPATLALMEALRQKRR